MIRVPLEEMQEVLGRTLVSVGFDQMAVGEYAPDRAGYALQRPFDSAAETTRYIERFEKVTANEFEKYKKGQYTTWLGDLYDYYIALNPGSEAAYEARQLLTGIFKEARKKSEALNACFVVLVQPSEIDFGDTAPISYQDLGEFSRSFRRDYRRRNLTDIAKAAAIAAEVDYIDLFELYENSAAEPYTSYRYDKGDSHWNSAGVRIAAEALSRFIAEKECLNRVLE